MMRSSAVMAAAVLTTCSMSVRPPARCSTFAFRDFIRVPRPAARITIVTGSILLCCPPLSSAARQAHGDRRRGLRIVPHLVAFAEQFFLDYLDAHLPDALRVVHHRARTLLFIAPQHRFADGTRVQHGYIDQVFSSMLGNGGDVV